MNSYAFNQKNHEGDYGVKVVTRYLNSLPETLSVINVEKVKEWQKSDIDLVWVRATIEPGFKSPFILTPKIEVKTDNYDTGNFFIETVSNVERNKPGWIYQSDATYIFYVFPKRKEFYYFFREHFIHWFDGVGKPGVKSDYPEKTLSTKSESGKILYQSKGILVPICDAMRALRPLITRKEIGEFGNAGTREQGNGAGDNGSVNNLS